MDLIDLLPVSESVPVNGKSIAVTGLSAKTIFGLFKRFPELANVMSGDVQQMDAAKLMETGGDIVSAIIAAGLGHGGETSVEATINQMAVDTQVDLLSAVIKVTMPSGVGPFMEKLSRLGVIQQTAAPRAKSKPPVFPPGANVRRVKASQNSLNA